MVCVLYKDALCLATAEGLDQHYMVQACISLNTVKIEEADNGRGKTRPRSPNQLSRYTDLTLRRPPMPHGSFLVEIGVRGRPSVVRSGHDRVQPQGRV